MMKPIFYVLFFLVANVVVAQDELVKGYYIDNFGTRVEGYIKHMDWLNTPDQVRFATQANASTTVLTLNDISEFAALDNSFKFKKATVLIDMSETKTDKLSKQRLPEFEEHTVFLKVLVEGEASLYAYLNNSLERFFYKTSKQSVIKQLVFKEYYVSNLQINTNKQYQQQLMNDVSCNGLAQPTAIKYNTKSLLSYFIKYNKCKEAHWEVFEPNKERRKGKGAFHIAVKAGANFSSMTFMGIGNSGLQDLGSNTGLRVGLEFEYVLPINNNKWSIFTNLAYVAFDGTSSYINEFNESHNIYYDLDYKSIEIPIGVRHYFFLDNLSSLYVDGSIYIADINPSATAKIDSNDDMTIDLRNSTNFAFALGYKWNRFRVEAKYFTDRNVFKNYLGLKSNFKNVAVTVGYNLL